MKRFRFLAAVFLSLTLTLVCYSNSEAIEINLYVDAAPNVYGSSAWGPWKTNAYNNASNGTFVNMASGLDPANVGTNNFEMEDATVYSFGDLGRRLHFIYWVPNTTIAELISVNFKVSLWYDWDGIAKDAYAMWGGPWLQPSSWEELNGGVVGSGGHAMWGAYEVNTPEALATDIEHFRHHQGDVRFYARTDDTEVMITANHTPVPEPSTFILLGLGAAGLALYRKKRKTK